MGSNNPPRVDLVRGRYPGYELRSEDGDAPTLAGHLAVFDEWTEINSVWEGHFMERIAPGAFKKTMRESKGVKVLFNHGNSQLGDMVLGPINELREDDTGAYYEVELLDGIPDLLTNGLKRGQYGSSFRFTVMKEDYDNKPDRSEHNPDALPERTLTEVRLHEFGPVTFPAYESATAGVRSMTDRFRPERAAALQDDEEPTEQEDPVAATQEREEPPHSEETTTEEEKPQWLLRP